MIAAGEVMAQMKFLLGDMQGARFSDFELMNAINRAARKLCERFAERHVSLGLKCARIEVERGARYGLLPADFWKIEKSFTRDFRIEGERFYAPEGEHLIDYYRVLLPIRAPEDLLDMPETVKYEFAEICAATAGGEEARPLIDRLCNSNIAREVGAYADRGPVQVWGGRG